MAEERVFISYVRENQPTVESLVAALRQRGFDVWYDRDTLQAGTFWKDEIRNAIRAGGSFIACFSAEYNARERTYMNEELEIAIEEIRLRGNSPWFIPVRLSGEVPDRSIGAGRSLRDIQFVDLTALDLGSAVDALARSLASFRRAGGALAASRDQSRDGKSPSDGVERDGRAVVELAGTGQTATRLVNLNADMYRVSFEHHGSRNFIVQMLDSRGTSELLVNKAGMFQGSAVVRVAHSDNFLFDVAADGPWVIRVATPAIVSSEGVFAGSNQAATDLFHLSSGLRVFRLSHTGRSNFIVQTAGSNRQIGRTAVEYLGKRECIKGCPRERRILCAADSR